MSLKTLYPYLYEEEQSKGVAQEECLRSCEAKIREIAVLRHGLEASWDRLTRCARAMASRFSQGGKLLTFGNGGSCTDAQAAAALFSRSYPALALTNDVAVLTALSNDVGFELCFSRPLAVFGTERDVALGISTSGNSENVVRALEEAKRRKLLTIGLAGADGGRMAEARLDHLFVVPSAAVPRIQEVHTTLYHLLWELMGRENADG